MRGRHPVTVNSNIDIEAHPDYIIAVLWIDQNTSIGVRFNSPEHFLEFSTRMLEAAAKVWPDNDFIREFLSEAS